MAGKSDNSGKEKVTSLQKHVESLKNRLNSKQIGVKHVTRPDEYLTWLKREIERTEKKLAQLKLA